MGFGHLARQNVFNPTNFRQVAGVNRELIIGHEGRAEKGESVNVIPMSMGQHQNAFFHAVTDEVLAKIPDASSGVEDNAVIPSKDFQAAGVPAVNDVFRGTGMRYYREHPRI